MVVNRTTSEVKFAFETGTINIGRHLQHTATMGFIALIALTGSIGVVLTAWAQDVVRRTNDQHRAEYLQKEKADLNLALENVAGVMLEINSPYVRLNSEDKIINANPSLALFLGLPGTLDSVQHRIIGTKFEDWIADPGSKRRYHIVQGKRRKGERVEPYELTFETSDRREAKALVVSSYVPASQEGQDSLPETFGILVPSP
jgi:hypothetical protein